MQRVGISESLDIRGEQDLSAVFVAPQVVWKFTLKNHFHVTFWDRWEVFLFYGWKKLILRLRSGPVPYNRMLSS